MNAKFLFEHKKFIMQNTNKNYICKFRLFHLICLSPRNYLLFGTAHLARSVGIVWHRTRSKLSLSWTYNLFCLYSFTYVSVIYTGLPFLPIALYWTVSYTNNKNPLMTISEINKILTRTTCFWLFTAGSAELVVVVFAFWWCATWLSVVFFLVFFTGFLVRLFPAIII